MNTQDLIAILQASLTPVILISGVGLLLLSMTNRIARPLDRIRFLGKELKTATDEDKNYYCRQIAILYERCFILQKSITFAVISIISVSMMILLLFLLKTFLMDIAILILVIFIVAIISLITSLIFFLYDIQASLRSVQIEMDRLNLHQDINV
jgi:hypothetical protein